MTETDSVQQQNDTQKSGTEKKRRKRNVGRRTTARDQLLKRSLYTALTLTTEQIAKMYFPSQEYLDDPNTDELRYSENSAKVRLYKLADNDIILNEHYTPIGENTQITYWFLTQKQYKRQAKSADRPGERYPDFPERLSHHFKTTEIYAQIQPTLERLFADLDPYEYDEWKWLNESHCSCYYNFENKDKQHRPDAEVQMPDGTVFFIERQTKESKKKASEFSEKVKRANDYARFRGYSAQGAKLLFACDAERDKEYVRDALKGSKIKGVPGDRDTIVRYLITKAKEIAESARKAS